MRRYKLLGINVDSGSHDEIYKKILKLTEQDSPAVVILLDTYLLMKAQFNKELFNLINFADLVLPVSRGIKTGLKFLNKDVGKVYSYFNFLIKLLLGFTDDKKYVYILGGKKKRLKRVEGNIKASFPGIRLVGQFHMEYKKRFEDDLITAIRKAGLDLVLVGDKSPKQEKWIYNKKQKFQKGVFIGAGNFINIVGGKGVPPTDKSVNSRFYSFKKIMKNPLKIYRIFYYIVYVFFLIVYKLFVK